MKTNEAPEKIYLEDSMSTDTVGELWPEWFDAKVSDDSIEYARTDAFIEKACEFISFDIADYIDVTHHGGIERVVLQERVIEEFIKYMKGE